MFAATVPLQHLSLAMIDSDAALATDLLASMEVIHLTTSAHHELLGPFPGGPYQGLYQNLENHLKKMQHYFPATIRAGTPSGPVSLQQLEQMEQQIRQLWGTISAHEEEIRRAREQIQYYRQLGNSLSRFENLNIDLGWLSADNPFLALFVGTIPHGELQQLQRALSLANSVVEPFYSSAEHVYLFIASEKEHRQDVEGILRAASFHQLTIPQPLQDHPEQLRREIAQQLELQQGTVTQLNEEIAAVLQQQQETLCSALTLLQGASAFASATSRLSGRGQLVVLEGWVAASRSQEITQQLQSRLQHPHLLNFDTPGAGEMSTIPSLQQHSRLLRPFQALVNQFGVPSYGEVDPTPLFAFSYILMFGMMFGDIGHGASIILIGFLLRHKIAGLFTFAALAGLSSILFGFLYGSLFGFEHLIHPLWMSPMEDPPKMLLIALLWGIGFLTIAQLLSIINLLTVGRRQEALWSGRGAAGLLFFGGGIFAAYRFVELGQFGLLELAATLLPLGLILQQQWQQIEGRLSEKILITLIEGIDKVINTLSATLSFLRVAAFSLNHVALAAAVFTLAEMMDPLGHGITLLLGNLFIIVLEGGIVAIQCLRLEYYEGFSRFFSGKGEAFRPLRLESHLPQTTN